VMVEIKQQEQLTCSKVTHHFNVVRLWLKFGLIPNPALAKIPPHSEIFQDLHNFAKKLIII